MKYVSAIKKFLNKTIFPRRFNFAVWSVVAAVVSVNMYIFAKSDVLFFKHIDQESGVSCTLTGKVDNYKFICKADDVIGVPLDQVNPELKVWNYSIKNVGDVIVEREGFSSGLEFKIKGNLLKKTEVFKIKY
ncbi:hypothetical protein [Photobacterium kishitanii]|uniref:Uncharacterized protein n=1 Tax=Photobacterium kishitanii TaxID=318456 RepID=A0A2T3KB07_9GAMM|nr:hypothetical protein [Photobacterium kishitanii]PSU89783.1 hypothetical protein C9J27_24180 [Photobacterium kishitanii]